MCTHPQRREIDDALLAGTLYRAIARRFGMHTASANRHARCHLSQRLEESRMLDIAAIGTRLSELVATARDVLAKDCARSQAGH